MKELTIEAKVENIDAVTDFVNAALEESGCSMKAQTQIDIAIDELFGNIARYAYHPEVGQATVQVNLEESIPVVTVTFRDHGIPYNPLETPDPDVMLSAEERKIGGLGIYLVKKTMDEVIYEYKDGQNVLRVRKKIS